jgi:hypothetical protein
MISMAYMQLYHKYSHFNPHIYNLHVLNTPNYIQFFWSDSLMISMTYIQLYPKYIFTFPSPHLQLARTMHTQLLPILFFRILVLSYFFVNITSMLFLHTI